MIGKLTLKNRINLVKAKFPDVTKLFVDENKKIIVGVIFLTTTFKKEEEYYGSYPYLYLDIYHTLFPDCEKVLHLFSGKVKKGRWKEEVTFDINPNVNPNVVGNAEVVDQYFKPDTFDLILADPPYSEEHAKVYGYPMPSRKKVVYACFKILKPGGFLVWLDTHYPPHKGYEVIGNIGIITNTDHIVRMSNIFKKPEKDKLISEVIE